MPEIHYHPGQIEVQTEANTRKIADTLSHWVGPVGPFTMGADLLLLSTEAGDGVLRFTVLSGAPPLVVGLGPSTIGIPLTGPAAPRLSGPAPCGGVAVSLAESRRARLNGTLTFDDDLYALDTFEAFTNCRKYVAPSIALAGAAHTGPESRAPLPLNDPWLAELLGKAKTAFLTTISPVGVIDVSHRGGPPGFFAFDASAGRLGWPEFVGDGMLKSAGNIRVNGRFTLLVPDLETGDGVEIHGRAVWTTLRRERRARVDGLVQHPNPFPHQGRIDCDLLGVERLRALMHPRRRAEHGETYTSCSSTDDQAPQ